MVAETDLNGNTTNEYVFFAGRRISRIDASGNVFFYYADHLGTTRTITNGTGTTCYDADFTPYGQEMIHTNTCPQNYKFTGYERDPETGLDYAMFRYYNSRLGRFMGADPLAGSTTDPQSMNRYAYVSNDPLGFIDPLGLDLISFGGCLFQPRDVSTAFVNPNGSRTPIGGTTSLGAALFCSADSSGGVLGLPLIFRGFDEHGRSGGPHVDQKALADCIDQRFGVTLISFSDSQPGQNGSFTGRGPDYINRGGNNGTITVTNDVSRYSSAQLEVESQLTGNAPSPPGQFILGLTISSSPSLNFTANNVLQLGFPPLEIVITQVHELGNSLEFFTRAANGDRGSNGDNDAGQKLEDCVRRNQGFRSH